MKKLKLINLESSDLSILSKEEKKSLIGGKFCSECYCLNGFIIYIPCGHEVSCVEQCGD